MKLTVVFGLAIGVFIVCTSIGVDRQVTLHLNEGGYALVGVIVAVTGLIVGRMYWRESSHQTGWSELANLRSMAPARWLMRGVALVTFALVVSGAGTWYLLRILVPYLPGVLDAQPGVITDMYDVGARGRACNTYAKLTLDGGRREDVCYERGIFNVRYIRGAPFTVGDRVIVTIIRNTIGSAIQSVVPAENQDGELHQ